MLKLDAWRLLTHEVKPPKHCLTRSFQEWRAHIQMSRIQTTAKIKKLEPKKSA